MSKKRSQYIALAAVITAVVVLAIIAANMFFAQNAANDAIAKQQSTVIDPVTIALTSLFERKGKIYLRTIVLNTIDSKELPNGGTSGGWDLAEFVVEMNWG